MLNKNRLEKIEIKYLAAVKRINLRHHYFKAREEKDCSK